MPDERGEQSRRVSIAARPRVVLGVGKDQGTTRLATLLGASTAFGQLTEAQVKGTVRDADGNAVAQAPVVVRNEATGQVRSTATDDSGTYFLAGLQTGVYTVFVRVPGFKTYEAHNVKLDVGQTLALEVRLEVGDLQESVDVIADADRAPIVTDGRLSDTVGRRQISSLPLAQRDIFLLPKLSAGATAIPGAANSTKLSSSPVVTVNGNRYRGNHRLGRCVDKYDAVIIVHRDQQ